MKHLILSTLPMLVTLGAGMAAAADLAVTGETTANPQTRAAKSAQVHIPAAKTIDNIADTTGTVWDLRPF